MSGGEGAVLVFVPGMGDIWGLSMQLERALAAAGIVQLDRLKDDDGVRTRATERVEFEI